MFAPSALAQKYWQGTGTGDWAATANWSPSGAPTNQAVHITNGGTAVIGSGGSGSSAALWLGGSAGGTGGLVVLGSLSSTSGIYVGGSGAGALFITNSGSVGLPSSGLNIGQYAGGSGTVSVDGTARLYVNGYNESEGGLVIGKAGRGDMTVAGSGSVWVYWKLNLGKDTSGSGTLTLADNGMLHFHDPGYIGDQGTGVIIVKDRARLESNDTGSLYVGRSGTGALFITDSGSVGLLDAGLNIGQNAGSSGTVRVDGTARLYVNGYNELGGGLVIGKAGRGDMTVAGSGSVWVYYSLNVGKDAGGSGTLTLADNGVFCYEDYVYIGDNGAGVVIVKDNAILSGSIPGDLYVGRNSGNSGTGALYISDQGRVITAGAFIANNSRSLLDITLTPGRSAAYITAASVGTLSGTLRVNGLDAAVFPRASLLTGTSHLLIDSAASFAGNFSSTLFPSAADYLVGVVSKTSGNRQLRAGASLAWFSATNRSHGNFTLGAGETFEVDTALSATTAHGLNAAGHAWDGATLTVTASNSGTLILSGSNTLAGLRVLGGWLVHRGWTSDDLLVDGGATFLNTGGTAYLTATNAVIGGTGAGYFVVDSGTVNVEQRLTFGRDAGALGTGTLLGGLVSVGERLHVGGSGAGALTVAGGTLAGADAILLGAEAGGSGTALMSAGLLATTGSHFIVGNLGAGALTLTGGTISAGAQSHIGSAAGSSGTVLMSGGLWTSTDNFGVGNFGAGALTLAGGTLHTGAYSQIGSNITGSGTVLMSDGLWTSATTLVVGSSGTGALTLTGGTISAGSFVIGAGSTGTGALTVDGGLIDVATGFYTGNNGRATLTLTGGTLRASTVSIGHGATGSGTVSMRGGLLTTTGKYYNGGTSTGTGALA
ncbi:MAG: hypothetical protein LBD30_06445, partial [Verrucomicrobiales bacterium]|nr:hypothetical protein [Verrucomicrobiales bacterium]